ncbi:MAG: nicotinate (nicotinamide) nucleotide adenylyltransferase [Peptococcaceae bacterium]|nr:nicotinate (nicotinamide) nucleotide adenylyltransferase [Peptococcaceae bacterium]
MQIGLFGGTFDPIHLGHVDMINQLCEQMQLDKVVFIPSYIPPHKHKAHMTSYRDRLAMTKLAVAEEPHFEVSTYESEQETPSYTYHTVLHFSDIYPDDVLYYIVGVDAFNDIETWYRWRDLLQMVQFIVIDRPGRKLFMSEETKKIVHQSAYDVHHLALHTLPVSSTMVRQRLQAKESVAGCLAPAVQNYIEKHQLYEW